MNTFVIPAHGVSYAANSHLSYAQDRLLTEPRPIRLCGAPTGAGKTYAFIEAARRGQVVFFVVPTQTWTLAFFASLRWLIQKALQDWHISSESRRLLAGRLQEGACVLIAMLAHDICKRTHALLGGGMVQAPL